MTMKTWKPKVLLVVVGTLMMFGPACDLVDHWPELGLKAGKNQTWMEWNPIQGMHKTPAIKDQEDGMRYPPAGSVPMERAPYSVPKDAAAMAKMRNPIPISVETLAFGKIRYETTCIVCHGPGGKGDGSIVPKYPQPPSLLTGRVGNWSDGEIYNVITHGQGRMWSYKSQLRPEERWAIIHYIRALQRADSPEPQDSEP
jgi:mono/diheme cytochrome c family protein